VGAGDKMKQWLFKLLNNFVWWLAKIVANIGGWKNINIIYHDEEKWHP
jgi:hypothetical protein